MVKGQGYWRLKPSQIPLNVNLQWHSASLLTFELIWSLATQESFEYQPNVSATTGHLRHRKFRSAICPVEAPMLFGL
jgi:hypothetical protein